MADNYNDVHVIGDEKKKSYQEVKPDYVYLTIPADWVCVYHKLLTYMADFGKTIVDDCNAACKGVSKNIITCWNLFQSALACRTLGREKEAEFFINYIQAQLKNVYRGTGINVYDNTVPLAITKDGKIKAIASCSDETHFYVDVETGKLYEKHLNCLDDKVYTVDGENLTVANKSELND